MQYKPLPQSLTPQTAMPFAPARIAYPGSFDPANYGHLNMLFKAADGHPDNKVRVIVQVRPKKKSVPRLLNLENAAILFALAVPEALYPKVEIVMSPTVRSFFKLVAQETTHIVRGVRTNQRQMGRELIVASALNVASALTLASALTARQPARVLLLKQDPVYNDISSRHVRRAIFAGGKAMETIRAAVPAPVADMLFMARRQVSLTSDRKSIDDFNHALRQGMETQDQWRKIVPNLSFGKPQSGPR